MHVFLCPNCGWQALEQRGQSAFFRCTRCFKKWCIVDATDLAMNPGTPTLYGALGTFHEDDVVGSVKLNTIDKGVSL